MRRGKFCSILILALGFGAFGCGGGSTATTITIAVSPSTASVITNTTQTFSDFVTGSTDLATAGAGADAVLGKPFTIEELEETVTRLVGSSRR